MRVLMRPFRGGDLSVLAFNIFGDGDSIGDYFSYDKRGDFSLLCNNWLYFAFDKYLDLWDMSRGSDTYDADTAPLSFS